MTKLMLPLFVSADGTTFRADHRGDIVIIGERRFKHAGHAIDQNTLCDGVLLRRPDDSIPPGPPNDGQVVYIERPL